MRKNYDFSHSIRNPHAKRLTMRVTLRLGVEVIAYFKALAKETGVPYQNLIALYLRDCVASKRTTTIRKTFDCVEMKNRIQAKIMAEYQAHKDEFPSFEAFTAARVRKSAWGRRMIAKFARRKRNPPV